MHIICYDRKCKEHRFLVAGLRYSDSTLYAAYRKALLHPRHSQHLSLADLADVAAACAAVGYYKPHLLSGTCSLAMELIPASSPRTLARFMSALDALRFYDAPLCRAVANHYSSRLHRKVEHDNSRAGRSLLFPSTSGGEPPADAAAAAVDIAQPDGQASSINQSGMLPEGSSSSMEAGLEGSDGPAALRPAEGQPEYIGVKDAGAVVTIAQCLSNASHPSEKFLTAANEYFAFLKGLLTPEQAFQAAWSFLAAESPLADAWAGRVLDDIKLRPEACAQLLEVSRGALQPPAAALLGVTQYLCVSHVAGPQDSQEGEGMVSGQLHAALKSLGGFLPNGFLSNAAEVAQLQRVQDCGAWGREVHNILAGLVDIADVGLFKSAYSVADGAEVPLPVDVAIVQPQQSTNSAADYQTTIKIAVQLQHEAGCCSNDRNRLLASAALRRKWLSQLGWAVVTVRWHEWVALGNENEKQRFLIESIHRDAGVKLLAS